MVIRIIILIETILIWQWNFWYSLYSFDMIENMKAIYTQYHWFPSIHMFDTYTTSRTGTKYHEIQLRLP